LEVIRIQIWEFFEETFTIEGYEKFRIFLMITHEIV